jgi:menaquinone-9 beta-reductase
MADVFVIGGGPAGLAAAIAARRKGLHVVLADAMIPPIDKACGEGLMPDGLAALGALGVSVPQETSYPFRGIRFVNGDDSVDASFPKGLALGVRRMVLHGALVEHAGRQGVQMMWGAAVTGIDDRTVQVNKSRIAARWIVGADGASSRVRKWAGLESSWRNAQRFGFRRHYRVAPWTDRMEIHWGPGCQMYVTPVSPDEVCIALISRDSKLRMDDAMDAFPELLKRIGSAPAVTTQRGSVTASRRLCRVHRGNVALIGDASGSVDAITGEGLCLAFKQSIALATAIANADLGRYESEHRRIWRRPAFMADFMLTLGESPRLRRRAIRALAAHPDLFANMLAMHVGELRSARFALTGAMLGARMLTV